MRFGATAVLAAPAPITLGPAASVFALVTVNGTGLGTGPVVQLQSFTPQPTYTWVVGPLQSGITYPTGSVSMPYPYLTAGLYSVAMRQNGVSADLVVGGVKAQTLATPSGTVDYLARITNAGAGPGTTGTFVLWELLAYDRALSPAERQQAYDYMTYRAGLTPRGAL